MLSLHSGCSLEASDWQPHVAQLHAALSPSYPLPLSRPGLHTVPQSLPFRTSVITPAPFLFILQSPELSPASSPGSGTTGIRREPRALLGGEWLRHLRDFLQERPATSPCGWGQLDRKGPGGPFSCSSLLSSLWQPVNLFSCLSHTKSPLPLTPGPAGFSLGWVPPFPLLSSPWGHHQSLQIISTVSSSRCPFRAWGLALFPDLTKHLPK